LSVPPATQISTVRWPAPDGNDALDALNAVAPSGDDTPPSPSPTNNPALPNVTPEGYVPATE
ncbi:MAG: hypothetical protein ACXWBO_00710, partial [Ilumatobacteraceae bacterium]